VKWLSKSQAREDDACIERKILARVETYIWGGLFWMRDELRNEEEVEEFKGFEDLGSRLTRNELVLRSPGFCNPWGRRRDQVHRFFPIHNTTCPTGEPNR
jgi:hypothetical protein